jgi:hypothetical protein
MGDGRPACQEDEEIVYDFCTELNVNKYVSDATYSPPLPPTFPRWADKKP